MADCPAVLAAVPPPESAHHAAGSSAPTPPAPPSGGLATGSAAAKIDVAPLSFQFELLEHRMPLAEQIDAPPGVFLRDILGTIIRHIIPAVHRLDPRPTVTVKPFVPNFRAPHVFAVAPQRMDMIPVPPWILLQRIKIRHAAHFRSHEFLITPLRRPDGRLRSEEHT